MTMLIRTIVTAVLLALVAPVAATAHHGDGRFARHHHHRFVALAGTVTSVDASAGTLVVDVAHASRKADALEGEKVTVEADHVKVRDANDDGHRTLADVESGNKVVVLARRAKVDVAAATVDDALVFAGRHRDGDCRR